MTTSLVCRRATIDDIPDLIRFGESVRVRLPFYLPPPDEGFIRAIAPAILEREDFLILVTDADSDIRGALFAACAPYLHSPEKRVVIEFLYGEGGSLLWREFKRWCRKHGARDYYYAPAFGKKAWRKRAEEIGVMKGSV